MSLIEQAAQRLAQLRQAGVDMPPQSEERVVAPTKDEPVRSLRDDEPPPTSKRGDQEALQSPEMAISRRVELDLSLIHI